jgi:hypothetical protein
MGGPSLTCEDPRRREAVRARGRNGIDYLEVSDDQRTLTVYLLGKAPKPPPRAENVVVEGGPGAPRVEVERVEVRCPDAPDRDDCVQVRVDRPGDYSAYTLRLVEAQGGKPTRRPLDGFDVRYAQVRFSFKGNCPSDLDCATEPACPSPTFEEPDVDYLAKDYASFRQLILDRLALVMPDWQERHVPDLGITLVELLAYVGDYLSYYQDAVATEAYLRTARQRISVRRHARLVDYDMHEGCNARALVHVEASQDFSRPAEQVRFLAVAADDPTLPVMLGKSALDALPVSAYQAFEPLTEPLSPELKLREAHNEIHFYTWDDQECCLPAGAAAATLVDAFRPPPEGGAAPGRALDLHEGDVLIFEEVIGPRTGDPADADTARRHAVRLTRAEQSEDPLYGQPEEGGQTATRRPLVEIEWRAEDALPFPFCLSAIVPERDGQPCVLVTDVSVARGNVVLVDHGATTGPEDIRVVGTLEQSVRCEAEGEPAETPTVPRPFTAVLARWPVTFSQPLPTGAPASGLLDQDPRLALPRVEVAQAPDEAWQVQRDLLDSGARDQDFVVEVDNQGRAHLRFGDGELGRMPPAGATLLASYRVGNGPTGNVGAEAISRIAFPDGEAPSGIELRPRNPLPARGGTAPEPIAEVKELAPEVFRSRLRRAITADDYAALASAADPQVQRAAATLRWTGSWYEVLVTVDPLGAVTADDDLLRRVERQLGRYRRIGHDLVVAPARYVPLDVAMDVCVRTGFVRGHVKAALLDAFSNRVLPDGRRGFFHPDNLTFGQGVASSRLVAAALAVPGVQSADVTRLQRLFEPPNQELETGVLRLAATEVARLDNDPNAPHNGKIVFTLRGGR